MNIHFLRKAFSLIELVFVIAILGIVASIGSSIIVQVYDSYITQRAVHNASIKTELAINQLANRLLYRINTSVVARQPGQFGNATPNDIVPLSQLQPAQAMTHIILEWIGYDNDGFSTQGRPVNPLAPMATLPAWSGFTDLDKGTNASTFAYITSTGSALVDENTILNNLFVPPIVNPALVFLGPNEYRTGIAYSANCMYNTAGNGCIFPVAINNINPQRLTFLLANGGDRVNATMIYSEFYQLAASAYAVVPAPITGTLTPNGTRVWSLTLRANYQPWMGENYSKGIESILLRNVSVFRFTREQNSVRIKLCTTESIGATDISICKEKAVIR